ncbi:hypothetical protein [Bdellovibrio sp. KM01]|uniref:hypothetical protein n=1 Tax=Bdellovibrio sp. KM01 TaxID=2748865 RepID=UPI0015E94E50|nr:hypothetical protein [Bdellovibrio sp. KM01]QLY24480.1 hypothetical protein HW988_13580 [Bdellovibrio sp. KM01]
MKILIGVCVLFFSVNIFAAKEVQNGGGGTSQDGSYQTFGSARISVDKDPLSFYAVPGLSLLTNRILRMPLPENVKGDLLAAITPSLARNYHQISSDKFDPEARANLVSIYAKLLNISPENVVIFAVTEPKTKKTMLLPEFFRLNEIEQAAILFHEALWLVNPRATYEQIINIEQAAQAYFQEPTRSSALLRVLYSLGVFVHQPMLPLVPAIILQYRPDSIVNEDWSPVTIPMADFFGGSEGLNQFLCKRGPTIRCLEPFPYKIDLRDVIRVKAAQNPENLFYLAFSDFLLEPHPINIAILDNVRGETPYQEYYHGMFLELSIQAPKTLSFVLLDQHARRIGDLYFFN